ncbi:MAG: TetR/AcrR family transcriptional regulator [Thermoleophilia bacterium]
MSSETAITEGARARNVRRTRERIVEAAMGLHTSVGPARTSVSAIAERAGVQRHTVYAHFPDEASIFRACTGHWLSLNPLPDHGRWTAIAPFEARVAAAIDEVSAYWERTSGDLTPVFADAGKVAAMDEARAFWDGLADAWVASAVGDHRLRGRRRARMEAALRHALAIDTWRTLTAPGGMTRPEAVRLMTGFVRDAAAPAPRG